MKKLLPFLLACVVSASAAPAQDAASSCTECHEDEVHLPAHKSLACADCHSNVGPVDPEADEPHAMKLLEGHGGNNLCLDCHEEQGPKLLGSVHKKEQCTSCHGTTHQAPVSPAQSCRECHKEAAGILATSVHGRTDVPADRQVSCGSCHGDSHAIARQGSPTSPLSPLKQIETCSQCHRDPDVKKDFLDSVHGRALTKSGLTVAATCTLCHGTHGILAKDHPDSMTSPARIPKTCGVCHAYLVERWQTGAHGQTWSKGGKSATGKEAPTCFTCHGGHKIQDRTSMGEHRRDILTHECLQCHDERYATYRDTFHGKASRLGLANAPVCSDCHTAHENLKASDPKSSVHPANLKKTCGACHGEVNDNFVAFMPHLDPRRPDGHPVVHWIWVFMSAILAGTFGFFGIHTLLWAQRLAVGWLRGEIRRSPVEGDTYVRRFRPVHIWVHVTIVITFLLLALTGLPLHFHDLPWASSVAGLFGGIGIARRIHHAAGVATFGYAVFFISYLLRRIVLQKRWDLLWGWKSMVPHPGDLRDLLTNIKWFLYLGPPLKMHRWTYWEKFDFFAVFWGVPVIGFSGMMLWMPHVVTQFVPGWVLNAAAVIHGDEALLATGFIFFFHFFHTHARPENFPLDTVIFTGRMPLERFKEERAAEYQALVESGDLESHLVGPPSPFYRALARYFGTTAFLTGLVAGGLLLYAGFHALWHG